MFHYYAYNKKAKYMPKVNYEYSGILPTTPSKNPFI